MRIVLRLQFALAVLVIPATALAQSKFVNEVADGSANYVGTFTSLALDAQGNPHVSYWDATTGNLLYARKSAGVWTIETADGSANVVGWYTSLALDAQGNPHVSYQDATTGNLKYARKSGAVWTTETADGSANDVGYYTSLALDALGNPHVSYHDGTTTDLMYARKSGGVWTVETAESSPNYTGLYTSLALDAQGNPNVTYWDGTTADLMYARRSGGVWTIETADGSPYYVGLHTSLALDAQGNPHVSYRDGTNADLMYARRSGGVWTTETADGSANDVGWYTSLALDAEGVPHVTYSDVWTGDLKYASKVWGAWTTETADAARPGSGYSYSSLALDAQGNPHVSYYDGTTADLKYADAAVHLLSPVSGVTWAVGSRQEVSWAGVGTVDLYLTSDGSGYEEILADDVIASPIAIRVPHIPSRFARLVLYRWSPFSTSTTDSFFTINATITLLKFEASAAEGASGRAVRLSWETAPGPEADVRYRLERARGGGASSAGDGDFAPIHAGLLDRGEYLDSETGALSRYRLIAVNGLGEEYVLGETAAAPGLARDRILGVHPNPAPGGKVEVLYRVPFEFVPVDVSVYDPSGRRVRTLVSGTRPADVSVATWDGADDQGRAVGPGIYFVRFASASGALATERLVVVR